MKITVLTDNSKNWFIPFGKKLIEFLSNIGHDVLYVFNKNEIEEGDICFLLSCSNIVNSNYLQKNKYNIVVHASDLPKGKGFSPLQWQILEGKNEIVLTLFEAVDDVDAGPYYLKEKLSFDGTELYIELREKLAEKIIQMCLYYIENINHLNPISQVGEESFYPRRKEKDDEIAINKSINEQFNHFRIADNEKYPLYFYFNGCKYYLKIYKDDK